MVLNEGEGRRSRRVHIYRREEGTVIDLMLGDSEVKERIEGFKGGDRVELNHQPVEVRIKRG